MKFNIITKKIIYAFIALILFLIGSFYTIQYSTNTDNELYEVVKVTDGDTITVKDNRNQEFIVRYIGIDTPESVKPNTPVQCFAINASNKNKELVLGKKVRLEKDMEDKDKYSRLLRYVYIDADNNSKYEYMINELLVKDGYATVATFPPNVKYVDKFKIAEQSARENQAGLWKECQSNITSTTTPVAQVSDFANKGLKESTSACKIKGNISSEKVYHLPGQKYYDKTIIEPENGEFWFCSEADAIAAGWRKSKV